MTTTATPATARLSATDSARPTRSRDPLGIRPARWHRPLLALAASMVVLALFCAVAMVVDHRQLTGLDVWVKPFKFAVSTAVYSVTLAWMIGLLTRFSRVARIAGTVSAVGLAIELVIITAFAALGETSHFNITTPLHTAAWATMAFSIVAVWVMTLVVAILLFRNALGDRARTLAIRSGAVLAVLGMGLAYLMTGPKGDQISNYQGIVGAHTVGVPDGGPGLPLLGWSTVGGDLRIPHFIGMHGLQALPLFVIALELLARRVPLLADGVLRFKLVTIAAATYLAVVLLVAWQALIGQSIVHPGGPIVIAGASIAVAAVVAVVVSVRRSR